MQRFSRFLAACAVVTAVGCTNEVSRDDSVELTDSEATGAFTAPVDLDFVRLDAAAFGRAPKTSIDYAVM